MDELSKNLVSPSWWFSVVLAGIVVNVVAAYAKPALDRLLAGVSSRWAAGSNKRKLEKESRIGELRSDETRQILTAIEVNRNLLLSLWCFCLATVLLAGMGWSATYLQSRSKEAQAAVFALLLGLPSTILMLGCLFYWRSAWSELGILEHARPKRKNTDEVP